MTHRDAPRAGRTTWPRLARALAASTLIGSILVAGPAASQAPPPSGADAPAAPSAWPDRNPNRSAMAAAAASKDDQVPGLSTGLQDEAQGSAGTAAADEEGVPVMVEAVDAETGVDAVESVDGTEVIVGGDLVEAVVPADRLAELAAYDGVRRVSEPRRAQLAVESEGVFDTASNEMQDAGFTGAGTTVAVVDGGFTGHASRLGTELPASPEIDFSRCGATHATDHGTAVAEIVHDMAPDATLRLVCIDTAAEFINALDNLPAAVDVVNVSLGWTALDRGDGSGPVSAAVERARAKGMLVVVAAGNYGRTHRNQLAVGDTTLGGNLSDLVDMPGGDDGLAFAVAPHSTGFITLQWDSWPTTAQDFDLYIESTTGSIVAESFFGQDGNDPPIEFTQVTNTSASVKTYFVLVDRYAGSARPRLDIFFDGGAFDSESPTASGIGDPAVSRAAMAVGTHCWQDNVAEIYSSRGPTIDGRVSPDIAAPDGTSSSVYGTSVDCAGGFHGTSAAAPHVAGAAAQLLESNPLLDVAELQRYLERNASLSRDYGPIGIDNTFGAGSIAFRAEDFDGAQLPGPHAFTPITPKRLMDSRPGSLAYPGEAGNRITPIPAGGTITTRVTGGITGIPADAVAVVLNVTAVSPTADGFFTVFPQDPRPNVSSVNFRAGEIVPVHVTATVGGDGRVRFYNALGSTHLIVDIAGWYGPTGSGGPSASLLTPLAAPSRALDTRPANVGYAESPDRTTPIGEGGILDLTVAGGSGPVPAEATTAVLNVTAITPTKGTFLTAFPAGSDVPDASNLNAKAGQIVANLVVVPIGDGGVVRFFNQLGDTHLVVDVLGYFQEGSGAAYVPLDPPTRQLDTRTGTGLRRTPLGVGGTYKLKVARLEGVPGDAAAVMLGVVAVTPTRDGWLTVYPGTASLPTASNVNFAAGQTRANAVLASLGSDGTVAFNNPRGTTHVISDLAGYFIDPANVQLPPP